MKYCIIARYVAESYIGGVVKDGKPLTFKSEDEAREWGRAHLEGKRYIAMWDAVPFDAQNKQYFFTTRTS